MYYPKNVCFPTKHREKVTGNYDTYMEKRSRQQKGLVRAMTIRLTEKDFKEAIKNMFKSKGNLNQKVNTVVTKVTLTDSIN